MAVRVGFEPTEPVKVQRFSRPPDSTTLAPHRGRTDLILPGFCGCMESKRSVQDWFCGRKLRITPTR